MEKPTARQRSSFGAFQMGTSHIKTNIAEIVPRASALEMAEMRRDGRSLEDIGEAMGISASTVRGRLNQAGFRSNGDKKAKP